MAAEGISATDHENSLVTETIENVSMTDNVSATEETPVEELSMELEDILEGSISHPVDMIIMFEYSMQGIL